jgi:CRP-like cAMP-binding protein
MAALALSPVDLIVIEDNAFLKAQEGAGGGLSMEDRVAFINKVAIFKGWDQYRLYKVAHTVEQVEFNKGAVILDNDDISPKIYILLSGAIDVYTNAHSATPLNSLSQFDYVGESGFLNASLHTRSNATKYAETFCLIARTRVLMLTFPESEFHIIDGIT